MLRITLWLSIVLAVVHTPVYAEPPTGYSFLRYDEGIRAAQENGKKVFIYFGRFGCGFCDRTNRESFSDPRVHERYHAHYNLVYVNAESGRRITLPSGERITEMQLGERMNTMGTPVFIFLEPDGSQIFRLYGYRSADVLLKMDEYVKDAHYTKQSLSEFMERAE